VIADARAAADLFVQEAVGLPLETHDVGAAVLITRPAAVTVMRSPT
jgi:hypothetical protein